MLHRVFRAKRTLPVPRLPPPTHEMSIVSCHRTPRSDITHDPGKPHPTSSVRNTHNLNHRNGPARSLPMNPFQTLVLYANSATTLVNTAKYPRSRLSSPSLTPLVFTLSVSPTASVTTLVPLPFTVISLQICGGSLQRGKDRVQHLPTGYSNSFAISKHEARSTYMIYMPPLSLSWTPRA